MRSTVCLAGSAALSACGGAWAQECGAPGVDVVVTEITAPANFPAAGGYDALACGYTLTNFGSTPAPCEASGANHPSAAPGLYVIGTSGGVSFIRQIAAGWLHHEFFELSQGSVCGCTPTDGASLGVGCSTSTSASIVGNPSAQKGPRWQADPATGRATFPRANPAMETSLRRLSPSAADLLAAAGSRMVVEVQVLAPGEAEASRGNNASRRDLAWTASGAGDATFSLSGATRAGSPAIEAWAESDPGVRIVRSGAVYAASRAVEVGTGVWRYRYAVQNVGEARGFGTFVMSVGCAAGVRGAWFSAPVYHGGDGIPADPSNPNGTARNFDATPWVFGAEGVRTGWRCATPAEANGNALRWGTLYTFGFDASTPPRVGGVELGYFAGGGGALLPGVLVPSGPTGDFNGDGFVDQFDYAEYVSCFEGAACPAGLDADVDGDGFVDFFDYGAFVEAFERGC